MSTEQIDLTLEKAYQEESDQQQISSLELLALKTGSLPKNVLRTISKPLTQEEFETGGIQEFQS